MRGWYTRANYSMCHPLIHYHALHLASLDVLGVSVPCSVVLLHSCVNNVAPLAIKQFTQYYFYNALFNSRITVEHHMYYQ